MGKGGGGWKEGREGTGGGDLKGVEWSGGEGRGGEGEGDFSILVASAVVVSHPGPSHPKLKIAYLASCTCPAPSLW